MFKQLFMQMVELVKVAVVQKIELAKPVVVAVLGYALMLGATPYAAWHVPQGSPMTFIGGILVVGLFLMGAYLIKQGLEQFEALSASMNAKSVQLAKPAM